MCIAQRIARSVTSYTPQATLSKKKETYHSKLKQLIDMFVHKSYDICNSFPKEGVFGLTSQLKRASLSVALNYTEGYARQSKPTIRHFCEISYGSLKESLYIIDFVYQRKFITQKQRDDLIELGSSIGKMLWGITRSIKS